MKADPLPSIMESARKSWKTILAVAILAGLAGAAVLIMESIAEVPLDYMTEDPLQTADLPFYTGLLSNLGAMLWAAAAGLCFLGASLTWKEGRPFWFFLGSGLITAWFGLDDLLLFHDQFLRYYVGIPERPLFAAYVLIFGCFLLVFLKDIFREPSSSIWICAWICLGVSMLVDVLLPYGHMETFIEDVVKFAGIGFWLAYFFRRVSALAGTRPRGTS